MEINNWNRAFIQLPSQVMFMIKCVGSGLYLRQEDHYDRTPSILAAMKNDTDYKQYWVFQLADAVNMRHKIVNASSGLLVTCRKNGSIHLAPWKESPKQLFYFVHQSFGSKQNIIIRCTFSQGTSLALAGSLVYRQINPNACNHIFHLEELSNDHLNNKTTVFVNSMTQKALGIVNNSRVNGEVANVTQTTNNFVSHRWLVKPINGLYYIENFNSGLCLDCRLSNKIYQTTYSGIASQLWNVSNIGNNQYIIQATTINELCLGVSMDGQVTLMEYSNEATTWKIMGRTPEQNITPKLGQSQIPNSQAASKISQMLSEKHSNMARSYAGTGRYMMISGVTMSPASTLKQIKSIINLPMRGNESIQATQSKNYVPQFQSVMQSNNALFPSNNLVMSQIRQVTSDPQSFPLMSRIPAPPPRQFSMQPIYIATDQKMEQPQSSSINRRESIPSLYVSRPNS